MVSVYHKELEYKIGKAQVQEVRGHAAEVQKLIFDGICIPLNKYVLTFLTCTVQ